MNEIKSRGHEVTTADLYNTERNDYIRADITGNSSGIKYTERRDWDAKICLLSSIDKAQDIVGYQPKTGFKEGLEKTYNWFLDKWENIYGSAEF